MFSEKQEAGHAQISNWPCYSDIKLAQFKMYIPLQKKPQVKQLVAAPPYSVQPNTWDP